MIRLRSILVLAVAAGLLTACDSLKEALTAHVDTVARAGSQELTVQRLATLIEKPQVSPDTGLARFAADLWVNYQLLGVAAAHRDSLSDTAAIDRAMWEPIANARIGQWLQQVSETLPGGDSASGAARYNQGELLAAEHILLRTTGPNGQQLNDDSVRRRAEALRARANASNFAQLARENSQDPGSAARGGSLGVFPRGTMVPQFEQALLALRPGEISPVVRTGFGYHIIRRPTFSEVREEFQQAASQESMGAYVDSVRSKSKIELKSNALPEVRNVTTNLDAHVNDNTVIATSTHGNLTTGRFAQWLTSVPQRDRLVQGMASAPDSVVSRFVTQVFTQELLLRQADSAGVKLDTANLNLLHSSFIHFVSGAWDQLGVAPSTLGDSSVAVRERAAGNKVEEYVTNLFSGQAQLVQIPPQVAGALREKFEWRVNQAGITRAVELAKAEKARTDSAAAANRPATQIPLSRIPMQGTPAQQDSGAH
ncbi:MAG TPA: peptidylprolyl isomerase [Gemmatimonadaceae bacterium]|nr:peptidylprolyl isomerase [Gemmatimonadaceae bacterium]